MYISWIFQLRLPPNGRYAEYFGKTVFFTESRGELAFLRKQESRLVPGQAGILALSGSPPFWIPTWWE
jgi:hypothetical protein